MTDNDRLCWVEGIPVIAGCLAVSRPLVHCWLPRLAALERAQQLRTEGWLRVSVRDRETGERISEQHRGRYPR